MTTVWRVATIGLIVISLAGLGCAATTSRNAVVAPRVECEDHEAAAAEEALEGLTAWSRLYDSFRRFGHCDDGGVAAGWSDSIVRLLTEDWSTISVAAELGRKDRAFRRFLLGHVDELMSVQEERAIMDAAEHQCPRDSQELCRQLVQHIRSLP